MDINAIFFKVDNFWKEFEKAWNARLIETGERKRNRKGILCESEIMTLMILFHQSCYRNFKTFYIKHVCVFYKKEFPNLVSYPRFVTLMKKVLVPMYYYLNSNKGTQTGISYVDSTSIKVCHNKRINRHKVFDGLAKKGLQLITTLRSNMKNKFMPIMDKILLRKRFIIETINDQLKNISQIEHTRHRSVANFLVNIFSGLAAYIHQPKKPAIIFNRKLAAAF